MCAFEAKSELKAITTGTNFKLTIITYCKEFVAGIQAELRNLFPRYTQEVVDYSNPQAKNLHNKLVNFGKN